VGDELAFASALEQAELVRRREVSPVELVELYLERIERLDGRLGSYVTVAAEQALAATHEASAAPASSDRPFHGVPLSVKDLVETAGIRTTFSARPFADYIPRRDPAVVRRLRDAGFVVIGKTNTCELGTLPTTESILNGPCRSPWDTDDNAGGSSGGAGAALAAGLCPASIGSDGGGSIRIPAACCGVVGLKPARGRVSPSPYAGFEGLATTGPLTRTVADAAAILDVIAGYETGDESWATPPARPFADEVGADPGRLRIAVTTQPPIDVPVDRACVRAVDDAGALLTSVGHAVEELPPDWSDERLVEVFGRVWQVFSALTPPDVDASGFEPLNRALAAAARATSSADYAYAVLWLKQYARRVLALWGRIDVLVAPVLAQPFVPVGWLTGEEGDVASAMRRAWELTPFTFVANVTGLPAMSLPLAWNDGRPVGVQLIGPPAGEATLLRLAAQLETAVPWRDRRPGA
jgi:amidase